MKKTQIFAGILCLGITATLMTGCGKSETVVSDKEDDCIVVELPDDSEIFLTSYPVRRFL